MPWYAPMMGLLLFVPGKSARVARAQFAQPAQNWVEGLAFAATERTKERIATRDRDALTLQSIAYPLNDLADFDLIMPAREFFRGNLLDQQLFPRFLFTWRSRIWLATEHIRNRLADLFHKLALFFLILEVFAEGAKFRSSIRMRSGSEAARARATSGDGVYLRLSLAMAPIRGLG
jgi:hypothetical protein